VDIIDITWRSLLALEGKKRNGLSGKIESLHILKGGGRKVTT